MYFQYDTSGVPFGFIYNDVQYFYITNQMGDVIAITDTDGTVIASYTYDAWGGLLDVTGTNTDIANANPIRYRGYYYDSETSYYYLQSRYYDPSICRFINSDIPEIAKNCKEDYNGLNLFIYCGNDSINNVDYTGYQYSPAKAKAYADKWWNNTNSKCYMHFSGDCANFVSQCLYAGGIQMMRNGPSKWYFNIDKKDKRGRVAKASYSRSWSYAHNLYLWLKKYHSKEEPIKCKNNNEVITFLKRIYSRYHYCSYAIFMDFQGKNKNYIAIDHAALSGEIVKNSKNSYDMYYYAHTSNRAGRKRYYGNNWQKDSTLYNLKQVFINNRNAVIYFVKIK